MGLGAITKRLLEKPDDDLIAWWHAYREILSPLENLWDASFASVMQTIASIADILSEGTIWRGTTGRQLVVLWEEFSSCNLAPLDGADGSALPAILTEMFGRAVVRPPYGGHPRIAIYGLLEARLQQADMLICAGLNEGTWPQLPQPDPWLSPAIRRKLNLATLDRNIGLSAHDLSIALGAKKVLLTRAKRDRSGPTVASRFLLRIKAYLGDQLQTAGDLAEFATLFDRPAERIPFAKRPGPMPTAEQRRVGLSITDFDQLKSDPFSFYAKRILRLKVLDPVASEPSYAWRGTVVHDILEKWFKEDKCSPDGLMKRAGDLLSDPTLDPALRALWQPRIAAGLKWISEETGRLQADEARTLLVAEVSGDSELAGVKIRGRADRIDRLADGSLAIVDYKTGAPPKAKQVTAGFALQLGLVGLMAERGQIDGASGKAARFEYWSLAKNKQRDFGFVETPTSKKEGDGKVAAPDFVAFAIRQAEHAIGKWITGNEPFDAKLHPEYANYEDYDQLMRLQEWNGRQPIESDGE